MPFIGTPLDTRNTFQSLQGKRFSGDGSTTAFTLDIAPSSVFDIEVFVENVRQDPNSAYSISGTTLTFTGAPPSGTNNIYVIHQAKAVGTINPSNDSVTASSIADDAVESEHLNNNVISGQTALTSAPADTDELLISDAGTIKRIDVSLVGGKNTPAFMANLSATQSIPHDSATKVAFASEVFDTDSVYDASTNYRFTPGVAGKYFLYARIGFQEHNTSSGSVTDQAEISARIYKNGTSIAHTGNHSSVSSVQGAISCTTAVIADLDADDYVEVYASVGNNNSNNAANLLSNLAYNEFGGYKLVGV